MGRLEEDLFGGTGLHDLTGIHDVDAVGHVGDDAQVMGDEDNGQVALLLDLVDQFQDLGLNGNVQSGGGLVADQDLGVAGQSDGDNDTLTHTAGELEGILIETLFHVGDTYGAHQIQGAVFGFLLADLVVQMEHLSDLLTDLHDGVQSGQGVLEDQTDTVTADGVELILGQFGQVHAVIQNGTVGNDGVVGQNTHDGTDTHRFAGAGLTDDGQGLAAIQIKADTADGLDQTAVGTKIDLQILDRQDHFSIVQFSHKITPLLVWWDPGRLSDCWRTY